MLEVLGENMDVTNIDGIDTGVVMVAKVDVKVVAILNKGAIVDTIEDDVEIEIGIVGTNEVIDNILATEIDGLKKVKGGKRVCTRVERVEEEKGLEGILTWGCAYVDT